MQIELQSLRPYPIPEKFIPESEIWEKNILIESGRKCLLAAQSGKGKSTLLHILYGLRKDCSGETLLDGRSVFSHTPSEWESLRKTRISLLFQDLKLFPWLSAIENIELIPEVNPEAPSIEEMLVQVGMEQFCNQPIETLSFGQRQRIALLRCLRKPFDILLLDEPFSHLDEENTNCVCRLVDQTLERNQASLILSSLGDEPPINFDARFRL
jgi:ABC-type lipoprotein export system ATPase subunit